MRSRVKMIAVSCAFLFSVTAYHIYADNPYNQACRNYQYFCWESVSCFSVSGTCPVSNMPYSHGYAYPLLVGYCEFHPGDECDDYDVSISCVTKYYNNDDCSGPEVCGSFDYVSGCNEG